MTVFIDDLSIEAVDLLKSELVYAKRRIAHLEGLVEMAASVLDNCPWCGSYLTDPHKESCAAYAVNGEIK